jgi:multidrug efflux pump subunit AcrB
MMFTARLLQPLPPAGRLLRQAPLAGHRRHRGALHPAVSRHGQGAETVLPELDPPRTQCRTAPATGRLAHRHRCRSQTELESWLDRDKAEHDQFEHYIAYIGTGSPRYLPGPRPATAFATNVSQFVILTRSVEAREALRGRLIKYCLKTMASGVRGKRRRIENGPPVGYPVQYRVSGENIDTLRTDRRRVAKVMRGNPANCPTSISTGTSCPKPSKSRSTRTRRACSAFPARTSRRCSTCR